MGGVFLVAYGSKRDGYVRMVAVCLSHLVLVQHFSHSWGADPSTSFWSDVELSRLSFLLFIPGLGFYGGGLFGKVLEFGNLPFDYFLGFFFFEISFVFTLQSFCYYSFLFNICCGAKGNEVFFLTLITWPRMTTGWCLRCSHSVDFRRKWIYEVYYS